VYLLVLLTRLDVVQVNCEGIRPPDPSVPGNDAMGGFVTTGAFASPVRMSTPMPMAKPSTFGTISMFIVYLESRWTTLRRKAVAWRAAGRTAWPIRERAASATRSTIEQPAGALDVR